jgi:hypothetical protein
MQRILPAAKMVGHGLHGFARMNANFASGKMGLGTDYKEKYKDH